MIKILKKILCFSGKHKGQLVRAVWYHIFYSVFEALPVAGILYSLTAIAESKADGAPLSIRVILITLGIMLISVAGRILFHYLANRESSTACFSMCADQRIAIGERLKRMPMGFFNTNSLGEITSSVTTTMNEIEAMAGTAITNIVVGLVHAVILTLVITMFHWKIGLISFAAILLGLWVNGFLQKKSMEIAPEKQDVQASLASAVLEYIQGISVVKAYGLGETSNRTVDRAIGESCHQNLRFERLFTGLTALYSYIFKAAACGVLMAACCLFAGGELSLFNALTIVISSFVMYSYIEGVGGSASLLELIDDNLNRIQAVYEAPVLDENGADIQPDHFDIEFKDVSFSYDTRKILDHVDLRIPERTTAAIVGPSGGGKSTLCSLIARFWDVDSGEVLLNGRNVKDYTSDSLLSNISIVFQNVYLFRGTIADNIRFGRPGATMEQIMEAAKKACCHDFITEFPQGYDTLVGEGGGSLSGGQKQRISIARAILKDAPIIILDEATSSVDPENELQLQTAIEELTKRKTVIMIAHRLTTVRHADQILVLSGGKIAERGRHEELVEKNGLYREFLQVRKRAIGWSLDKNP
ncbi:ABC transporter ATP-binding protein [Lacrimispora sp.]|uniref:ABC transporter ATP-binding protein n=1 Tax=Lacrimispora sp. TaxID=2719234 RepID=UPI0028ACAB67|nr:ABC transporter ATP-binding protein [Lacrimispora sp.]